MIAVGVLDTDGLNGPDTPVNLVAVQADEAFLSMLGGGQRLPSDTDAELTRLLVAARRDAESEAYGDLVSVDEAMAVIGQARRSRRWSWRPVLFVVVCVLVIVACVAGMWSYHADPGELLWPLHQLLYGGAR